MYILKLLLLYIYVYDTNVFKNVEDVVSNAYLIRHGPFDILGGGGAGILVWAGIFFFGQYRSKIIFFAGPSGRIIFFIT